MQMITYWAPRTRPGMRSSSATLFDYIALPYGTPQYLEALEIGFNGTAESVTVAGVCELEQQGYIYIGVSNVEDPRRVPGAREITDLGSKPDLRTLKQLTVAYF